MRSKKPVNKNMFWEYQEKNNCHGWGGGGECYEKTSSDLYSGWREEGILCVRNIMNRGKKVCNALGNYEPLSQARVRGAQVGGDGRAAVGNDRQRGWGAQLLRSLMSHCPALLLDNREQQDSIYLWNNSSGGSLHGWGVQSGRLSSKFWPKNMEVGRE